MYSVTDSIPSFKGYYSQCKYWEFTRKYGQKSCCLTASFILPNNSITAYCGQVVKDYRQVICTPEPDAFNPCEDLMGYEWLRIFVWIILLAALFGNSAVLIVLIKSRSKMSVVTDSIPSFKGYYSQCKYWEFTRKYGQKSCCLTASFILPNNSIIKIFA
jgi:hypothetical protein